MLRRIFLYLSSQKQLQRVLADSRIARRLASRFVAGETLAEAAEAARVLNAGGLRATLDHLGENVTTSAEAAAARDGYMDALTEIERRRLQSGISVKLTQLGLDISEQECAANLRSVVDGAAQRGNFVRVDMESSAYTERTLELVRQMRQEHDSVGAVIQAYLYRSEADVRQLVSRKVAIRLCKGAYNESPSVAFPDKADVDRNYLGLMRILLSSGLYHAIATHDPRMIDETCRYASEQNLGKDGFEFQMLYGIRPDLRQMLARQGYRVRIYIPYGRQWFSYFMRRLGERPANVFFLLRNLFR